MVEKPGPKGGAARKRPASETAWMARLGQALEGAHAAFSAGDLEEAERRARAVSALVKALRETHALHQAFVSSGEDLEDGETRTQFLRRVAGYMAPERAQELLRRLADEGREASLAGLGDMGP
ncbi:MAG: hypothetical protein GC206_06160 [Alphaproteobacteria bacterium]|nr:hypothetical protein [Alphaproteobacteria bacterium]